MKIKKSANKEQEGGENKMKMLMRPSNNPLITIITPTYNHEKFIGQCIESVLSQTYPHWEMIIIDDGSTDKTPDIIIKYKDERIKYIKQDNVGIYNLQKTYNKALMLAKGELIAILEGDDFWPPDKLQRQISAFDDESVVLTCGGAGRVNSNGKLIFTNLRSLKQLKGRSQEEILRRLILGCFIVSCTAICSKKALIKIGGFKQPHNAPYVDFPTWLELATMGKIEVLADGLYGFWRFHPDQITLQHKNTMYSSTKDIQIDFYNNLSKDTKKRMNLTINEIEKNYKRKICEVHFGSGRYALYKHNWNLANKEFKKALNGFSYIKIGAIFGIFCSYVKCDMEFFAKILGKPLLSELYSNYKL